MKNERIYVVYGVNPVTDEEWTCEWFDQLSAAKRKARQLSTASERWYEKYLTEAHALTAELITKKVRKALVTHQLLEYMDRMQTRVQKALGDPRWSISESVSPEYRVRALRKDRGRAVVAPPQI